MFDDDDQRIFASIHTNSAQRMIVGRQIPFSEWTQTYCIQTKLDAMKNIHCMGMKNKQIKSLVMAMQMKRNENAYNIILN